jgi:acyl dehydratase
MVDLDVSHLQHRLGDEVAVSEWIEVGQGRIDQFAVATGDHQWIHVDPVRAAAESPFGTTIAHGFLTLSLVSTLKRRAMNVQGVRMAINYGLNRVRFIAPVPAGSRIRGRFSPSNVEAGAGWRQVTWAVMIEREGGDTPVAVAEWIVRYYPGSNEPEVDDNVKIV